MTQTGDLIKKMSDFFTSEEFSEKGEDARLELSPDDVRCMCYIIRQRLYMSLEQDDCNDMGEIKEVMSCDADAETKCKMISNILTAKPHYFKEQEPCDDCISRQAVLKLVNEDWKYEGLESDIENLPPVTPQTRWIPVSERLPEFGQDVLLSLRSLDITTGFRAKTEPYFYCHGVCYVEPQNVLAWMPLPEPHKAESEE